MHINVAKDGRRERDKADGNPKEAHIFDVCIVIASEGLRLLFWSKIAGAGGGGASSAPCVARLAAFAVPIRQQKRAGNQKEASRISVAKSECLGVTPSLSTVAPAVVADMTVNPVPKRTEVVTCQKRPNKS